MSVLSARINVLLTKMSLLQDGSVGTIERKVSGSTNYPTPSFRGGYPLALEWSERFERLLIAGERDLEEWTKGTHDSTNQRTTLSGQLRSRIRTYKGRDAVWVAFVEKCSVPLVEKVRRAAGLDIKTGLPSEKPLTAPAPTQDI